MDNNNLYDIDNWKLSDYLSTGSNWKDALIGGISGLGSNSSKQYMYAPTSQWLGNGLASTRVGMYMNPKYRDYASAGRAMAKIAQLRNNQKDNTLFDGAGRLDRYKFDRVLPQAITNATRSNNVGLFDDNASSLSNDYLDAIPYYTTNYINGVGSNNALFNSINNETFADLPRSLWG